MPSARRGPYDARAMRFLIHEKLLCFGDDFWIENEAGRKIDKIGGRAFNILRERLSIEDAEGCEVGVLREKLISLRKAWEIHIQGGHAATVSKDLLTLFQCSFSVDVPGPEDLEAQGDILTTSTPSPAAAKRWRLFRSDGLR